MMLTTVAQSLRLAARELTPHSESPQLDAEVLLSTVLGIARSALMVRGPEPLAMEARRAYRKLIDRRAGGEPVAYLTGTREFWSLPLKVTPSVLVPRPETELIVELALELLPSAEERTVLDLGTGSGAIALAIASERPRARITGVDLSPEALAVAGENARVLALANVEWRLGCWFDAVPRGCFDVIVANPPYVAADDPALESLAAEPRQALSSGPTGLEALQAIIQAAPSHLRAGGWLLLEHGCDQHTEVAGMLERRGFAAVRSHRDLADRPRVTRGTLREP